MATLNDYKVGAVVITKPTPPRRFGDVGRIILVNEYDWEVEVKFEDGRTPTQWFDVSEVAVQRPIQTMEQRAMRIMHELHHEM